MHGQRKGSRNLWQHQRDFIRDQHNINPKHFKTFDEEEAIAMVPETPTGAPQPQEVTPAEPPKKNQKLKRDVKMHTDKHCSHAHKFSVHLADIHQVIHMSELSRPQGIAEQQKKMRGSFNRSRFTGQACPNVKTLIAPIAAAAPGFALSMLAFIVLLIVGTDDCALGIEDSLKKVFGGDHFCVMGADDQQWWW